MESYSNKCNLPGVVSVQYALAASLMFSCLTPYLSVSKAMKETVFIALALPLLDVFLMLAATV